MPETGYLPKSTDIVERRLSLSVPRIAHQMRNQVVHRRAAAKEQSAWVSFASQKHIRDLAVDLVRRHIWIATWGGVLCWSPETAMCVRYTSEHGLLGNATRCVAVDEQGFVWAGGQDGGLCVLQPEAGTAWRAHPGMRSWIVRSMISKPEGGLYLGIQRNDMRQFAVGRLEAPPDDRLRLIVQEGLASREVEALVVDGNKDLWLGNAWGLYLVRRDTTPEEFYINGAQACALARGGEGLWIGTSRGVYRFHIESRLFNQEPDWPQERVVKMAEDPVTGALWVITTREVGRIINNTWQPVRQSPLDRLNVVVAATIATQVDDSDDPVVRGARVWVGGAGGLYDVELDEYKLDLPPDPEDALSNYVQCLCLDNSTVWLGTARGLYKFDGQFWHDTCGVKGLRDVRSLLVNTAVKRVLIGTWQQGLRCLEPETCLDKTLLTLPVVSLAASPDGKLWAATLDAICYSDEDQEKWFPLSDPVAPHIGQAMIQVIHHQQAILDDNQTIPILWVGTSRGLFRYRPNAALWDWTAGALEYSDIKCLAVNPITNRLWVGTDSGLFVELGWQLCRKGEVRALAFGPEGDLWLGTATGLECWRAPVNEQTFLAEPAMNLTILNSGLAANLVTALDVRVIGDMQEVWVGSPAGVSYYRFQG